MGSITVVLFLFLSGWDKKQEQIDAENRRAKVKNNAKSVAAKLAENNLKRIQLKKEQERSKLEQEQRRKLVAKHLWK